MTLTHNDDTSWAVSARPGCGNPLASATGKAMVAEMNRIGMMIDLLHTTESTQGVA